MKQRVISALILLPLAVLLYFKGWPLLTAIFIFSIGAMHEFYKAFRNADIHVDEWMGYVSLLCLYMIIVWGEFISGNEQKVYAHLLCLWVFGTVAAGLLTGIVKKGLHIYDGLIMALGSLYIGFFFAHIPLITRIDKYAEMVWVVFIAAHASDIFALLIGTAIGKHKLCPQISPKKTIEGSAGGIICASLCCLIFGHFVYPEITLHCFILGFFGSAFSQCGDLIASMFKRKMGIKDYSKLIPGHGGILDRFDSVLLSAPFVYYYILVVLRP